jgi:hypothetical protein
MNKLLESLTSIVENLSVSAAIIIAGGIIWLTELHLTTSASADTLRLVKEELTSLQLKIESDKGEIQREVYLQLKEMNERLSRIEGKLN